MKTSFFSILSILLFLSFTAFAQTDEELAEIRNSMNLLEIEKISNLQKAKYNKDLEFAFKNNIPLNILNEKGETYGVFQGLDEFNKPLYLIPLDTVGNRLMNVNPIIEGGSLGLNIEGQGMTVGIKEYGNAIPLNNHIAFMYNGQSRVNPQSLTNVSGHATNVAGILLCDKYVDNTRSRGMAPFANAIMDSYMSPTILNLLVSNHSYGIEVPSYNMNNVFYDSYLQNSPYHLAVFANGNSGLNIYSTNKNIISVGVCGTDEAHPHLVYPYSLGNWKYPTLDLKVKPEITVLGSPRSSKSTSVSTFNSNPIQTSYAAPAVSGAVLLLQQLYKDYNPTFMRSSTVKGLMIHTAKEKHTPGPDFLYGFGILDVTKAAKVIINNGLNTRIYNNSVLYNNNVNTIQVTASYNKPLEVTICWLDPLLPGNAPNPLANPLTNDLDVRISYVDNNNNTITAFPWGLVDTFGVAQKIDNTKDPVEKIQLDNTIGGQVYTITVSHKGTLQGGNQLYSLIVSGISNCSINQLNVIKTDNVLAEQIDLDHASQQLVAQNVIEADAQATYSSALEVVFNNNFDGLKNCSFDGLIADCETTALNKNRIYNPIDRKIKTFSNKENKLVETINEFEPVIYPNPTFGKFELKTSDYNNIVFEIYNTQGEFILGGEKNTEKDKQNLSFDLSSNPIGTYYLILNTDKGIFSKKVIRK